MGDSSCPFGSDSETTIVREQTPKTFQTAISVEQIGLVYPSIRIDDKERRENIDFQERMQMKKLQQKKQAQSNTFINKMINAIKSKTTIFKLTKKDKKQNQAGECSHDKSSRMETPKVVKTFRFKPNWNK